MFELKVMEPAAFKFDYIVTQAGQSSAGMPENGCRTRRREEAESFSKKLMKVTSVAWQPHATLHATLHAILHATLHATLPNCWQGQHFGALMLLRNRLVFSFHSLKASKLQNAAPASSSVVLRVVLRVV